MNTLHTNCEGDETLRLELPATLKYLNVVGACVAEMLAQVEDVADMATLSYTVQLGIHEICTNIVQHAYTQQQEHKRIAVTMEMRAQPRCLCVTLWDNGKHFEQSEVQEPLLDEGQVHGYGLFLVRNVMDEVTYSRQPEGNCWRLAKKL